MSQSKLSPTDVKELAVKHFKEKGILGVRDTNDVEVNLISTGLEDQWYVAYNRVMTRPALFLYHISKPFDPPHYIPFHSKADALIEHVDFENVTNDDNYELVIELHFDYALAYQGREVIILRHPFGNPAYEVFTFPFEQIWESIDSFDNHYGMPSHSKRIENHASYEFFEGFILIKGIINYRDNHLIEYEWDKAEEEFVLILDQELQQEEEDEQKRKGKLVHKIKGNKILIEINAHEEDCKAYLVEDYKRRIINIPQKIHDELLCSQVTSLSNDGRHLIYTDNDLNAICIYDFKTKKIEPLLKNINSYEGVSEIAWAPGSPLRFGFVSVNQEELLENTCIHIFTFDKDREVYGKNYNLKVYYQCDLDGICVPNKDYNYRFDRNNRFLYTSDSNSKLKALIIK
jgi:hypothetical protein